MDSWIFCGVDADFGEFKTKVHIKPADGGLLVMARDAFKQRELEIVPPIQKWTERDGLMYSLGRVLLEEIEKRN